MLYIVFFVLLIHLLGLPALKVRNGPLNLKKLIEEIFESLKLYIKSLK